jgi:hypothetical protein
MGRLFRGLINVRDVCPRMSQWRSARVLEQVVRSGVSLPPVDWGIQDVLRSDQDRWHVQEYRVDYYINGASQELENGKPTLR